MSQCKHTIGIAYERPNSMGGCLIDGGFNFCHNHENWSEDDASECVYLFTFCPECGKELNIVFDTQQIKNGRFNTIFICNN